MANNNDLPKLKHFDGTSFLSQEEIQNMGFASVGSKVHISRKASFYSPQNIHIGENERVDDFCLLSGEITIGSNIHIAAYSCLMGQKGIVLHDFSQISTRVTILSATDDFSGKYLVGPQVPSGYRNVEGGIVVLERHSLIGAGSLIFPGITIMEGSAIGAMSLVVRSTKPWTIYWGIPAKPIKMREKTMVNFETKIVEEEQHNDY